MIGKLLIQLKSSMSKNNKLHSSLLSFLWWSDTLMCMLLSSFAGEHLNFVRLYMPPWHQFALAPDALPFVVLQRLIVKMEFQMSRLLNYRAPGIEILCLSYHQIQYTPEYLDLCNPPCCLRNVHCCY